MFYEPQKREDKNDRKNIKSFNTFFSYVMENM